MRLAFSLLAAAAPHTHSCVLLQNFPGTPRAPQIRYFQKIVNFSPPYLFYRVDLQEALGIPFVKKKIEEKV